jgi:CDGSH-type Zn-finger protein
MNQPRPADDKPCLVELEQGKTYAWCACGASGRQPYCDGSHAGTGLSPSVFQAENSGRAALCMCKQTKNPPYCDGSHAALKSP